MPAYEVISSAQSKHWNTLDLFGVPSLNVLSLPIEGRKITIAGFKALAIAGKTVITGGNGSAGTFHVDANLYDSTGTILTTAAVRVLADVERFTAGATRRSLIVIGERTVESVLDASSGTLGTKPEIFRSPIWAISFHIVAGTALTGSPTTAVHTMELLARS